MTRYRRYGVYYAPPAGGGLARFGAAWLGWDAEAGAETAHPDVPGLPRPVAELTATPRAYGLHGTLKPPFRLVGEEGALMRAVEDLAADAAAFEAPPLALRRLGSFLALTPSADSPALAALGAACVRELDGFRAPPTDAELAKRRANRLSARQEEMLARWGYPYVLDEFRFHLTLTGPLPPRQAEETRAALAPFLAPLVAAPTPVREVCVFAEAEDGRFRIVRRFPLAG